MNKHAIAAALLIAMGSPRPSEAACRKRIWSLDVSKLIGERVSPEAPEPVWGLAFSPDETQLAIGFGQHWATDFSGARGHVAVVAIDRPKPALHRFDVAKSPYLTLPGEIEWSPSGKLLAVLHRQVVDLDGVPACRLPEDLILGGFLSGDRMAIYRNPPPGGSPGVEVHRPDCSVEDSWIPSPPGSTGIQATCPAADLVVAETTRRVGANSFESEVRVLAYPSHRTMRLWTGNDGPRGELILADSCTVVCGAGYPAKGGKPDDPFAACWDIRTGEKTVEDASFTIADDNALSGSGGEWVAATVSRSWCLTGSFWTFLDLGGGCSVRMKHRMLWNAKTGRATCTWPVDRQKYQMGGREPKTISEPFAIALSATGKYLAEGGSGRVEVFAVEGTAGAGKTKGK